ncbi:MAG: TetR/AcrR family transcriptional regulator [Reyranella sp.]|nr:TetR/AcrR family transcriptional regulator [Reyranella sp.]
MSPSARPSPAPSASRRRRSDGLRTYDSIVNAAADIASLEGLDALTIGTLAERLEMSKSGLFAHFGSKEELQLATVEAARKRYVAAVLDTAMKAPAGMARIEALCAMTLDYVARPEFPGGCFFVATQAGVRSRDGSVRDAVTANKAYFRRLLRRTIQEAKTRRELAAAIDPDQLAYELIAVMDAATWSTTDERRQDDLQHAGRAVRSLLDRARKGKRATP